MSELLDGIEHPDTDAIGLWYVPENGYRWSQKDGEEGEDGEDKPWYLMPKASPEASELAGGRPGVKGHGYPLFRRKALLRDFDALAAWVVKQLEPEKVSTVKELIKAFADEHGWLGVGGNQSPHILAEPLSTWLQQLLEWHDLRTTWKAIRTIRSTETFGRQGDHEKQQHKARETLDQLVRWSEDRAEIGYHKFSAFPVLAAWVPIASAKHPDMLNTRRLLERFNKPGFEGLLEPAEYYVTEEVNKVARDTVRYGLFHFEKKARLYPTSLVGGLYFQFLTELEGSLARPRRCGFQRCKAKVFNPKRRGQKFCEQRCQQAEWRRKDRAKKKGAKNA